jgi:hypothetical protein
MPRLEQVLLAADMATSLMVERISTGPRASALLQVSLMTIYFSASFGCGSKISMPFAGNGPPLSLVGLSTSPAAASGMVASLFRMVRSSNWMKIVHSPSVTSPLPSETYCLDDVDRVSADLGIPWEHSKDKPFATSTIYIGLVWDLSARTVALSMEKKEKYLAAIDAWSSSPVHTLEDVQKLYGKLLHACLVCPAGRARLTHLEATLGIYGDRPFLPRHPAKGVADDLVWWRRRLAAPLYRRIPSTSPLFDCGAYSDASSGIGVAIVIAGHWRAWRLVPGWRTLNGSRDIAWAEAIGFELLVSTLLHLDAGSQRAFKVYGDNKGVVEGWWNYRSRNSAVNEVFKRVHSLLEAADRVDCVRSAYVTSTENPADKPSRGVYPPRSQLLPPISLLGDVGRFLIDATEPLTPLELRLMREGQYPAAAEKSIRDGVQALEREAFNDDRFSEHVLLGAELAYDE